MIKKLFAVIFATALIVSEVSCSKDSSSENNNYYMTGSERTEAGSAVFTAKALGDNVSSISIKPVTPGKFIGKTYTVDMEYGLLISADMVNTSFDLKDAWVFSYSNSNYMNAVTPIVVVDGELLDSYPAGTYSKYCKISGDVTFKLDKEKSTVELKVSNSAVSIYSDDNKLLGSECVDCYYKGPVTIK